MSLRVDLYPVSLSRLSSLFGAEGWQHGRAFVEDMREDASRPLDEALVDELLSGRLSASEPAEENGALAALIARFAYRLRDGLVLFDVGDAWNAFERLAPALEGETKLLALALVTGRPLIGARIVSGWNRYAWVAAPELDTFVALLETARSSVRFRVEEISAWLEPVRAQGLDVFVSIG